MSMNTTLEERIESCTRDLVIVNERLRDSTGDPYGSEDEPGRAHLQTRRRELAEALEVLGKLRRAS
jgi:hypothetical protein